MSTRLALLALPALLLAACAPPVTDLGTGGEKCTGLEHDHDLDIPDADVPDPVDTGATPTPDTGFEPCPDCQTCPTFVSRDGEFWAQRDIACVLAGEATGSPLLPQSVGNGSGRLTLTTATEARRLLTTSTTDSRARLGQQILVAKLNLAAFPWIAGLALDDYGPFPVVVATAETAYDSGTDAQRRAATTLLTTLNARGAAEPLWFDPTCVAEPEVCNGADDDGDGGVDESCGCP